MSVSIKQKNPGWIDRLRKLFKRQSGREVAIGYPKGQDGLSSPHYDSGASIIDVAIWNNFGTENIPRRPFMDNAGPALQKMWNKLQRQMQAKIQAGQLSEETLMKTAALMGETEVRKAIDALDSPPNSPVTIAAKKSSKPLIDSGDMRKYVKGVVRDKS